MTKPTPGLNPEDRRAIITVLDGAGVGALPDAGAYGDAGANTLLHVIARHGPLRLPNLCSLGLEYLLLLSGSKPPAAEPALLSGYFGRMAPLSPGKDTTSGHWELAGLILARPFPVFPGGFPADVIESFEKTLGRKVLGNVAASGTEIIDQLGELHLQTGFPIVYTSADSVFQIAVHEAVASPEQLYRWCETAREILQGEHAVGRVIARPFMGSPGKFKRTRGRRDYSLPPPGQTLLDKASSSGYPVAVIGKVADIFSHRGITLHRPGGDNDMIAQSLFGLIEEIPRGLLWATFGDFDTVYGHRNDSAGFAAALESFDRCLGTLLRKLGPGDLLFITADHGCDPTHPGTDHTREYVPLMAWGPALGKGTGLGTRSSLADLGASAALWLNLEPLEHGTPFI